MSTLLETMEADLAEAKAAVAAKEAALETLKAEAGSWLSQEVAKIRAWFEAVKRHL